MSVSNYAVKFTRAAAGGLVLGTLLSFPAHSQTPAPYGLTPKARQVEWFHRERMAFFHFNMNTFTNLELGDGTTSPSVFNPSALDCDQWIRTIKNAGITCAILTAKHHDGFCIWPSTYTTYSVKNSTWKSGQGDVVKEFTDACRKYGIKAGFYLSPYDAHDTSYAHIPSYNNYYANQLSELLRNYGTIWEIWWDGAHSGGMTYDWKRWADTVRRLQPSSTIFGSLGSAPYADSRWVGNETGTAGDPCWSTVDSNNIINENPAILNSGQLNGDSYIPAETDVSIRPGWFYHPAENNQVKTVAALWTMYFTTVGRNTVWLLNIPPDTRGLVNSTDSVRVDSLNCWIYGTFRDNLAAGAAVASLHPRGAGFEPANLVDTLESSYYSTPDAVMTDTVTFNLGSSKTFDVIMVQEVIQLGHRTTGWAVQSSANGTTWNPVTGATGKQCIGYQWLVRVTNPVTASYVRLCITAGRACPAIHTFGLFRQAFMRPPIVAVAPASPSAAEGLSIRIGGRAMAVPAGFAGAPVAVGFYDLRGRCVKRVIVPAGGSVPFTEHGLYLVKCSAGNTAAVRKYCNLW